MIKRGKNNTIDLYWHTVAEQFLHSGSSVIFQSFESGILSGLGFPPFQPVGHEPFASRGGASGFQLLLWNLFSLFNLLCKLHGLIPHISHISETKTLKWEDIREKGHLETGCQARLTPVGCEKMSKAALVEGSVSQGWRKEGERKHGILVFNKSSLPTNSKHLVIVYCTCGATRRD